jgi:hypothetical protein
MHSVFSCGDLSDPIHREFRTQREDGVAALRRRFDRAVTEGDLPRTTDTDALAKFLQTVNFGLAVQATTGATHDDLLGVVALAMRDWPRTGR